MVSGKQQDIRTNKPFNSLSASSNPQNANSASGVTSTSAGNGTNGSNGNNSVFGRTSAHQSRQDELANTNMMIAKANRVVLSDAIYHAPSLMGWVLTFVTLAIIIVMTSVALNDLNDGIVKASRERPLQVAVKQQHHSMTQLITFARSFIVTGERQYLNSYLKQNADSREIFVLQYMIAFDATPEEMNIFYEYCETLEALKELLRISLRLSLSAYPVPGTVLTGTVIQTNRTANTTRVIPYYLPYGLLFPNADQPGNMRGSIQFSSLANVTWPQEEGLQFVKVARRLNLIEFRKNLLDGSPIDLLKPAGTQLEIARQMVYSYAFFALKSDMERKIQRLQSLIAVETSRLNSLDSSRHLSYAATALCAIPILVYIFIYVRAYRINSFRILKHPVSIGITAATMLLMIACAAFSISAPVVIDSVSRISTTFDMLHAHEAEWNRHVESTINYPRHYLGSRSLLWLYMYRDTLGQDPIAAAQQPVYGVDPYTVLQGSSHELFEESSGGDWQRSGASSSFRVAGESDVNFVYLFNNYAYEIAKVGDSNGNNNNGIPLSTENIAQSHVHPISPEYSLLTIDSATQAAKDRIVNRVLQLEDDLREYKHISRIAVALCFAAVNENKTVFPPTQRQQVAFEVSDIDFMNSIDWDFATEENSARTYAKYFLKTNLWYTNKSYDLALSTEDKLRLCVATLYSARAHDLLGRIRTSVEVTFDWLDSACVQTRRERWNIAYKLLIASVVTSSIAMAITIFIGIVAFIIYTKHSSASLQKGGRQSGGSSERFESSGERGNQSGGGADNRGSGGDAAGTNAHSIGRFASHNHSASSAAAGARAAHSFQIHNSYTYTSVLHSTTCPMISFGLIIVVALILLAIVVLRREIAVEAPVTMNLASERSWFVARTMARAMSMGADRSTFYRSQGFLGRISKLIEVNSPKLYFKDNHYFGALTDPVQDRILFARSNYYALSRGFNAAITPVRSVMPNLYVCNISKGATLLERISAGVGLAYSDTWLKLIKAAAIATPQSLTTTLVQLDYYYKALLLGLTISTNRYEERIKQQQSAGHTLNLVISILLIVYVFLHNAVVVSQYISFLRSEEASARLMLRMIPQEAKESNPQISAFLESGKLSVNGGVFGDGMATDASIAVMSSQPVIAIDQLGIIIRFSTAAEAVFGYTAQEVIGRNVSMLMPPEIAAAHDGYLASYRRTGIRHIVGNVSRVKGLRKNGQVFPFELNIKEIKVSDDEKYFVGVGKDLSTRMELDLQDRLNKSLLDLTSDCIVMIDHVGIIRLVNRAVQHIFGFAVEELLGENCKILMTPLDAQDHDSYLRRYRETGVRHIIDTTRDVQAQRKSGEIFTIALSVREITGAVRGEPSSFIAFMRDASDRILLSSQVQTTNVISTLSPIPVMALSKRGVFMKFSAAAEKLFGFSADELVRCGMNFRALLDLSNNNNEDVIREYLGMAPETMGVVGRSTNIVAVKKNGDKLPIRLTVHEVSNESMESIFVLFATDITQIQKAEGQVQLLHVMREWSVVPIIGTNSAGIITSFNAAASAAFKYQPSEVIGRNCNILMPPSLRGRHDAAMAAHAGKGDPEKHRVTDWVRSETALRQDGTTFPAKITLREVKDPQTLRTELFAFVEDMTETRTTSQKLIVNEALLNMSPVPIISISGDGLIELFSAAAEQCFGYSAVEVIGENVSIIMPPEIRSKHDSFLQLFHKTGNKTAIDQTLTVTAVRRNGSRFPVEVSVREVRKFEVSNLGVLGNATTTSDRLRNAGTVSEKSSFVAYVKEMSTEGQLLEAKALGATIAALSPIPIIQSTVRGVITYVNPAACKEFKFEAREMIGQNLKMLMDSSIGEKHEGYLKNYEARRTRERKQLENMRGLLSGVGPDRLGDDASIDSGAQNSQSGQGSVRHVGGRITRTVTPGNSTMTRIPSASGLRADAPHSPTARGSVASALSGHHFWKDVGEHAWNQIQTNYVTVRSQAKRRDGSRFDVEIKISEVPRLKEEDGPLKVTPHNSNTTTHADGNLSGGSGGSVSSSSRSPNIHQKRVSLTPLGAIDGSESVSNSYEQLNNNDGQQQRSITKAPQGVPPLTSPGGSRPKPQIPVEGSYTPISMTGSDLNGTVELLAYVRNLDLQRKLEQANETIDVIVNMSIVPVVAIDSQGVVIIFSSAAEQVFGYRSAEVLGNNVKMLMPTEIAAKHDSYIRTYFKTGIKTVIGNVLRQEAMRKDGTRFPIELSVKEIIKTGHRTLFIAYLRPVANDTALEQATLLSQTIIDQSPIPVIVINLKGIIRTFNNAAVALTGFSQEEAVGSNVGLIMEDEEAKYHDRYLQIYAQTGIKSAIDASRQRTVRTKEGQLIEAAITVKEVVRSSGEVLYIGFVRDLTRELDLQSTTIVNDVVASLSPIPLICINERGTVLKFNAAAERDFKYSAHEVLGQNVKILMTEDVAKKHDGFLARFTARKAQHQVQQQQLQQQQALNHAPVNSHSVNLGSNPNLLRRNSDIRRASMPVGEPQGSGLPAQPLPPLELQLHDYGRRRTGEHFPIEITVKELRGVSNFMMNSLQLQANDLDGYNSNPNATGSSGGSVFVAFIRDLTARYEAEHYKSLYETVVDISPVPIISIQPDGAIIAFNRAAVQAFKYEFDEVYRCNVRMLMPREVAEKHDMYIRRYLETGVKTIIDQTREVYAKRKSGPKFPAKLLIKEIKEEDRHYFIANLTDISLTTALEHAWNINDCIVDMSDTAIVCTDSNGSITKFSRVACEVFKSSEKEMIGKDLGVLMTEGWRNQWNSSFVAWFNHQTSQAQMNNSSTNPTMPNNESGRNNSVTSHHSSGPASTLQAIFNKEKPQPNAKHVISPNFTPAFTNVNMATPTSNVNPNGGPTSASTNGPNSNSFNVNATNTRTLSQTLRCRRTDDTEFTALISINEIPKDEKDINDPLCVMTAGSHQKAQALSARANGGFVVSISNYTEQALGAEEDAVLAATEELAQKALVVVDGEGTIVRLNPSCATLFGYSSKTQLLGKNVKILMPDSLGEAHDAAMAKYLNTGRSNILGTPRPVLAKTRSGQHIQIELTAIRIGSGKENLESTMQPYQTLRRDFHPQGAASLTSNDNDLSETAGNVPNNNSTTLNTSGTNSTGSGNTGTANHNKNRGPLSPTTDPTTGYGFGIFRQHENPKSVLFLGVIENLHQKEEMSYAPLLGSLAMRMSATPLVITDKHGIILDINPATERVFDFTKAQAVGRNVGILMPSGFQKQHDRFIEKYLATGEKHAIDNTISGTGETRTGTPILLKISLKEFQRDKELLFIGALSPLMEPTSPGTDQTNSSGNGGSISYLPAYTTATNSPQQPFGNTLPISPPPPTQTLQQLHPRKSDSHYNSSYRPPTRTSTATAAPPMPNDPHDTIFGVGNANNTPNQSGMVHRQISNGSHMDPLTEPNFGESGAFGPLYMVSNNITTPQRPPYPGPPPPPSGPQPR